MGQHFQSTQADYHPVLGPGTKKVLLWATGLLIAFFLVIVLLIIASFYIFRHFYDRAPDPIASYQLEKRVEAMMPSWAIAEVAADEAIPVRLTKLLEADIPFKQDVEVWVDNDFSVPVDATFSIPIDQDIFVEADVPIKTEIPLEGRRVQTDLWGLKKISLPMYGSFPVDITIPFKGPIHIKTNAQVRVQQEITVHVKKLFTFPLDLEAHVSLPIDDVFNISLPDNLMVKARVPEKIPVDVYVRLDLPKQSLFPSN